VLRLKANPSQAVIACDICRRPIKTVGRAMATWSLPEWTFTVCGMGCMKKLSERQGEIMSPVPLYRFLEELLEGKGTEEHWMRVGGRTPSPASSQEDDDY
jgi:hypothetical protein